MKSELKEKFYKTVSIARDLAGFGFNEIKISDDEKIKQTVFESNFFKLYISLDLIRGESYLYWKRKGSYEIIPDPIRGICFFSDSIDGILSELQNYSDEEGEFSAVMKVYRNNPWVFSGYEWLDNPDFKMAIENADAWALREFRALKSGEYERVLHSYKKP